MRLWCQLKTCPAIWLSPLIVLIVAAQVQGRVSPFADPYVELDAANAAAVVGILAPLAALMGGIDGMHLRRAGHLMWGTARPRLITAMRPPLLTAGITSLFAVLGIFYHAGTVFVRPGFVVITVVVLTAWCLFGTGLAHVLHPALSLPLGFAGCYFGMMFARSTLDPDWIRHLTGFWVTAMDVNTVLSERAMVASGVFAAAVAAAGLLLLCAPWTRAPHLPRSGWKRRVTLGAACAGILAAGVAAAAPTVLTLGPTPLEERANETICRSESPVVCLWPEHESKLEAVSKTSAEAFAAWQQFGITQPVSISEYPAPNALDLHVSLLSRDEDIAASLAYATLLRLGCPVRTVDQQHEFARVSAVLLLESGVTLAPATLRTAERDAGAASAAEKAAVVREYLAKGAQSCTP
ncbi:hypothetical protein JT358_16125 [Micrococcales bacterium 31B]|nr:hypothetical protein [Micrococcales bacterium 31B]